MSDFDSTSCALNRLLLVEDALSSAMLVKSVFENQLDGQGGVVAVDHVTTLNEAIAWVNNPDIDQPDVVLLDLTLPDSIGLDTLRRFLQETRSLPVVVLTGNDDESIGVRAMEIGAQDYLIKDETYPRLLRRQTNYAIHRKRQELNLKQAKTSAEEATLLKDKFVSLVAHDLRSPLSGIVGLADLLVNTPPGEESVEFSREILATSRRLLDVVEELLDISRLQLGKVAPRSRFFDASQSVAGVVQSLGPMAGHKGIRLVNEVPEGSRRYADPVLFGQVLQNIATNAIKFSRSGGVVRFYEPEGESTAVAVEDQGTGIKPEIIPRLFRLEEKISTTGTAGEHGTGFGMPYSHNIMEAHGGSIGVESKLGVGSRFTLRLPERRPAILIIDDQPMVRKIISMHLISLGIDIHEADHGVKALELLERLDVDLILLDIVMPEMDGFELLERLQEGSKTRNIPVIMVTGDDKIDTRERALRLGAIDFTVKPVVVQDLVPRVRRVVC